MVERQRHKEEREPKLRPPYNRTRADYTGDVESSGAPTRQHSTVKSKPSKKSPAQLQREIDEALSQSATSSSVRLGGGTARSHSTIKSDAPATWLKVDDVVQFRSEPGTGGVIRRFDADDGHWAWVATPRGERRVPIEALRRVRKEHEARVRRSVGTQRGHSTIKASTAFDEARAESALIEKEVDAASDALRAFPRGSMGLTPDAIKSTPEYRAANARYQRAFAKQRAFNTTFTKKFAKELRAERDKRYGR